MNIKNKSLYIGKCEKCGTEHTLEITNDVFSEGLVHPPSLMCLCPCESPNSEVKMFHTEGIISNDPKS